MRNPLGTGALSEEDKKELDALATYITDNYMNEIIATTTTVSMLIQLNMPITSIVATLISAGYALKMYEMENLEDDFLKKVNNAN